MTSSEYLSNDQLAVERSGPWINSQGTNIKKKICTPLELTESGSKLEEKKPFVMKDLHAISQNIALLYSLQSLGMRKDETPAKNRFRFGSWSLYKTDRTSTMLYSSLSEHSREEGKVVQTPAGVKLFPRAISALSILAYDTCKLVNISSIVALMTVKACYVWL